MAAAKRGRPQGRSLTLVRNELVLEFPFDRDLLPDVRAFARWDGKVWRAPVTKLDAALSFARANKLKVHPEVEFLDIPPPPVARESVEIVKYKGGYRWIHLSFSYEKVKARAVKEIPGCTFDIQRGCWTAPLGALWECIEWAHRFNVPVDPSLRSKAQLEHKRREALYRGSHLRDIRLDGAHPDLDPHQRVCVAYVNATRRCFIADDIGLGKTFETIASLDYTNTPERPSYPALIVAPPKLTINWEKEFALWSPGRTVQVVRTKKDVLGSPDVLVIGWSLLHHFRTELAQRGFRAAAFDESHAASNKSAQRTRAAVVVAKGLAPDPVVLNLTGTAVSTSTEQFIPQLEIIGRLDEFGGAGGFKRSFVNQGNEEALNRWLRSIGYIRRMREDVLDLKPVTHGDLLVEGDLREYRRAEADIIAYVMERAAAIAAELGEDIRSAVVRAKLKAEAGKHLVEVSALRREAARAKLPAIHDWLEEAVESGKRVVVGAHHRDIVDAIAERWGDCKIQGGMTAAAVEQAKARFQSLEAPVIVLSMEAGKEGHTLTAATDVLMVEFPWTSVVYDQTWGRAWRKGQVKPVFVTAMLCAGTRDVAHFDFLGIRRRRVKAATDGVRPTDSGPAMVLSLFDQGLARMASK